MWMPSQPEQQLQKLFAGLTEHAFLARLGVADPPLIDYLALLLARFLHSDDLYRLRNETGRPLHEVVEMVLEAQKLPSDGRTVREVYRHIGDFTLFWTGLYPEALQRLRSALRKDHFIDYCEQGKRSRVALRDLSLSWVLPRELVQQGDDSGALRIGQYGAE